MGDLGIAAVTSLIHKERLRRLQKMELSSAKGVTNKTTVAEDGPFQRQGRDKQNYR